MAAVTINLNEPFGLDDVRRLLASGTDDVPTQLRVRTDGTAYIHRINTGDPSPAAEFSNAGDASSLHEFLETYSPEAERKANEEERERTGIAFRLESWGAGNGYVGPAAAKDQAFVRRIYQVLRDNWPNPSDTFIDQY